MLEPLSEITHILGDQSNAVRPTLLELAKDKNEHVRSAAAEALREIKVNPQSTSS